MMLSNRPTKTITETSKCFLLTKGEIKDNDIVELSSPLFPSIDHKLNRGRLSQTIRCRIVILKQDSIQSDGSLQATLYIKNNDVDNMYAMM
jgi:hypothetical protein